MWRLQGNGHQCTYLVSRAARLEGYKRFYWPGDLRFSPVPYPAQTISVISHISRPSRATAFPADQVVLVTLEEWTIPFSKHSEGTKCFVLPFAPSCLTSKVVTPIRIFSSLSFSPFFFFLLLLLYSVPIHSPIRISVNILFACNGTLHFAPTDTNLLANSALQLHTEQPFRACTSCHRSPSVRDMQVMSPRPDLAAI